MERIALYGGSFDPPHLGHVHLVAQMIEQLELDRVIVMPAACSPIKKDNPPTATAQDRLAMLQLAFEDQPKVMVSDEELRLGGLSYTVDTARALAFVHPHATRFLLMSEELAANFLDWRDAEIILQLFTVVAVRRINSSQKEVTGSGFLYKEIPWIEVSSSLIRDHLMKNESCQGLLAPKVLDYIQEHQLYCPCNT